MRILDIDSNRALTNVCIYLTPSEAKEMLGYLEQLVNEPDSQHIHQNDRDYEREITVAVYTDDNLNQFDERSRRLISQGN
jgi:hypothetical protein